MCAPVAGIAVHGCGLVWEVCALGLHQWLLFDERAGGGDRLMGSSLTVQAEV